MSSHVRTYEALGTLIASDVALPDLREVEPRPGAPAQVRIRFGEVAPRLEAPSLEGPAYQADPESFLLTTPQIRCLTRAGREIVVEPLDAPDDATLQTFLTGTPFAALCYQRGLVPLSATALAVNGSAIVLAGASGSGKSTLGAQIAARGYPLLSDDLVPVDVAHSTLVAQPFRQRLRLWRDVLDVMGLDHRDLPSDRAALQRYHLAAAQTAPAPMAVRRIYILGAWPEAPVDRFEPLRGLEAIGAVADTTVLPALLPLLFGIEGRFRKLVGIVGNTSLVRWIRRLDFDDLEGQVDAIEADALRATA
jgi:hypothetical protein